MTAQHLLVSFLLFFVQPLFLAGFLYSLWIRHQRLGYVRETYRMNFNRTAFEVTDYFFKGLLIALVISLLSIGLGVPLTIEWYLFYQGISLLLLLFTGSRFIHPVFTFSLTSIGLFLMRYLDQTFPLNWLKILTSQKAFLLDFQADRLDAVPLNSLFFIALFLFFTSFLMRNKDDNKLYPILRESQRGKKVAKYRNRFLWLLPLAILVPGTVIAPIAPWWPLLNIGGQKFAILFLPVLLGMHFTVSTQLIDDALRAIKNDFRLLALLAGILFLASYFYPSLTIFSLGLLFFAGWVLYYRHRQRENLWTFKYGPADEGLRVIAVRPDSPAERMDIELGMIITHVNDQEMLTKEDFYEEITYNRSYIHMRVKRADGEIIMVDGPLYDDDVNQLGLLLL